MIFEDPVGRFHLRNGASLHTVNWAADLSDPLRMKQSAGTINTVMQSAVFIVDWFIGIMVNYFYDFDNQENRYNEFRSSSGKFHVSDDIERKYL